MLMEEKKRDLPCKDDTREPGTGRALGGNAAMIPTVDMQPKCFDIVSHMFLQPI